MKLRCKNCSKLLAIGAGNIQIKCTRCKELNHFNTQYQSLKCYEHHNPLNKETYECSKQSPTNPIHP
ncbi:Com family DNA-binding transcriptional regulator [Moraxella bovoculi]|uniref:Com family DNA-binding transcriptional regulator n=1 Tax=Moraxella bovoculi TaxID=386891 RepID=UPI0009BBB1A7